MVANVIFGIRQMAYAYSGIWLWLDRLICGIMMLFTREKRMTDVSFTVDPLGKPIHPTDLIQVLQGISGVTAVHLNSATIQAAIAYDPQQAVTFTRVTSIQNAGTMS
jgi:hypothetical protein